MKGEHSEEENQWVFDNESYRSDTGIDLDIDKVEEVIKPQAGARFVGDVRDKSFVPVGFKQQPEVIKEEVRKKARVEFKKPSLFVRIPRKILSIMSKIERFFLDLLTKMGI